MKHSYYPANLKRSKFELSAWIALLVICAAATADEDSLQSVQTKMSHRQLSARDVGEYAGVPWQEPGAVIIPGSRADRVRDLNLAIASVNLNDDSVPRHWGTAARYGREQDYKFLPRVYFWDGNDRFDGPMRDVEVYWQRLEKFLAAVDVDDFCGIVRAEENVNYAGRPEVLAEVYRRIKQEYDIPVWQWWSPSSAVPGSGGWIPADGWVINPYMMPGRPFRRFVRKYLITGKPLVIMPMAETTATNKPWTAGQWQANQDQLDVAVEFNVPVAFYWTYGSGAGGTGVSFGGVRGPPTREIDRINHYVWNHIDRVRDLPLDYRGLPSADQSEGDVLEIGPHEGDKLVYVDTFSSSKCIDDATMTGFRDLVLDGQRLSTRGFDGRPVAASLTYRFAGDFPAQFPRVSLNAVTDASQHGVVRVAVSTDGATWVHQQATSGAGAEQLICATSSDDRFDAVSEFFVRIELEGGGGTDDQPAVQIDDLRIEADLVLPDNPTVALKPSSQPGTFYYADDFQTQRYRYTTRRTNDQHLEWSPGRLAVRMRPGGSQPVAIWQFNSAEPIDDIVVTVSGQANNGSLGTDHYLDVSTDGDQWLHEVSTVGIEHNTSGWAPHGLSIDLSPAERFRNIRTFFVRLRMIAESFQNVHPYQSGSINQIRVEARPAAVGN